jgi:tetratricopeptide (TPR) repeat protein
MKRPLTILMLVSLLTFSRADQWEPAPVFEGLGQPHLQVTTKSEPARRYFNQGLALCYAFNHAEAVRSFRAAAQLDPKCAMAYWGVAYAHGPHINRKMDAEATANAWAAIERAQILRSSASPREQAWIEALSKRYQPEYRSDRFALDTAYAEAMRQLVQRYPDDLDLQTLLAEAVMDTMPWDYWLPNHSPKPDAAEALAVLQFVLFRDPNHAGANHFLIHLLESGPHPEQALSAADRLGNLAPEAGHLVHMPSHIYMRVGMYHQAVAATQRALLADGEYFRRCRAQGAYPASYYPHNLHFLWWALIFEGRSLEALETAEQVVQYAADNACGPGRVPQAPRLRHLPWLTRVRFGMWDELLKVPRPADTNDFLVDLAFWHFSRGLAYAAKNKPQSAHQEYGDLDQLAGSEGVRKLDTPRFPLTGILKIADEWLAGKVAGAEGKQTVMIQHLQAAVSAEDALSYSEPAFWPFPVRPTLGAALLRAGDVLRAEQILREALVKMPCDPWALFGLEQALRAEHRDEDADLVKSQFDRMWQYSDKPLSLALF